MKHKLLSLFFAAIVAMNVYAADVWDGSSDIFTHGAGTEQSPYLIENAEQLAFIAEMVNAGVYTYSGNYFKLTTDLDLNDLAWTPIGDATHQFSGNFDGAGHTISKLKVTSVENAGLFGVVSGGTFANISISGSVKSTNSGNAGAVAGKASSNSIFLHCKNMCNINGNISGGIVGMIENGTLKKCVNHGNVTATICAGGIVGQCNNNEILDELYNYGVIDIINTIAITSQSYEYTENANNRSKRNNYRTISTKGVAGGIVGNVTNFAAISTCYNFGYVIADISKTPYSSNLSYNKYASWQGDLGTTYSWNYYLYTIQGYSLFGGIAGFFQNGNMNNCYNYGKVTGSATARVTAPYVVSSNTGGYCVSQMSWESNLYGGGLIGAAWRVNVYHSANIGDSNNKGQLIGGSTNWNNKSGSKAINVEYSYDIRDISSNPYSNPVASYRNTYIAFLGENTGYFDANKNYVSKTDAQMKSPTLPILLNTDSTIFIQDTKPYSNNGYPIFKTGMKVISNEIADISYNSAIVIGNSYNCDPTSMGFEYKESNDNSYTTINISSTTPAQCCLSGLAQGTQYDVRYWLVDDGIKYYSKVIQFTTLACPTKPVRSDTVTLCDGESYSFAGKTLTQAGIYHDSLVATTGCDSVIELVLQVTETYKYPRTETINRGESYDFYGQLLTEPGVYNEYIRTTNRCNWIELTLIVHEPDKTLTLNVNNPLWGSVIGAGTFEHGTVAEFSAVPAAGCYFVNWSDGETNAVRAMALTKDTTITANFAIHQFTITTEATNGSVSGGGSYNYGTQVTLTATADEHYHFVRWNDGNTEATRQITVTEDKTYSAVFKLDKFLVTFRNDDGTVLKSEEVEYGVMPIAPDDPTKESTAQYDYTFAGWTPTIAIVTQAATYSATYTSTLREYLVTFLNEDNTVISSKNYKYGETPIAPADPVKQNTAEYTYTFNGWDNAIAQVQGPQTYKATYTATKNSYTITWQDENGSLINQTTVEYGVVPTHTDPIKQNTAEYTYTFAGWTPSVVAVTGDATYKATFNATKNKYLIIFRDENGTELKSEEVEYGVMPIAPANPTKESTAQYDYTFAGWTPAVAIVSQAATYTATYTSTIREYLVTFLNEDNTVISSKNYKYGETPVAPADPIKQNTAEYTYTFNGWDHAIAQVQGPQTYKATYTTTKNSYTITWQNEDGSLIDQTTVEYGQIPAHADPVKLNTAEYTYTFAGWTPAVVAVTGDATYKATFLATKNSYTITWQDENGTLIDQTIVEYGVVPTHAKPTKQATAEYTYTFAGWTPVVVAVTGNATYKATFTATKNSYTITWQNEDGLLIDQTTVEYGVVPTHTEPIKQNTAEYTYTFSGWTPVVVAVTGNATYRATFTATKNKYLITFRNDDGTVLKSEEVEYGMLPIAPATPTKESTAQYNYEFAGWTPSVTLVSQAAIYTAIYNASVREYLVTFLNDDNSIISMQSCKYGSYPTIPSTPTKQATAEFSYTFAGWTPNIVAVSGDVTYRATFTATKNSYTITWQDENGSLIDQTTVEYGQIPAHADPVKLNTAEYTYTFAGWTPAVVAVTGNATYRATFTATKNSYTITWQNEDGSLIDQTIVEYGQIPAHADPVKLNTAEYTYTFAGWTPAVVAVTGNTTYKATFSSTKNSYTITWQDENGSLIDQTTVEYGQIPAHADPVKQNTAEYTYTFAGWTPAVVAVTGNATYKATFTATKNSYTITWQNEDGSLIDQTTVEYGVVPTHAEPTKEATEEYTYTFTGWTPAVVAVTGDATYTATFSSVINVYTISVSAVNGQVIGGGEYQYGATIDLTAIPNEGYVFDQWSDGVKDNPRTITVTGDAEYTALFTSTEGFENIYTSEPVQKVIIDQKVYILRGEKVYTLQGQEVK